MSQRRPCAKAIGGSLQEEKELTKCHRVENFMWRVVGNGNGNGRVAQMKKGLICHV